MHKTSAESLPLLILLTVLMFSQDWQTVVMEGERWLLSQRELQREREWEQGCISLLLHSSQRKKQSVSYGACFPGDKLS